MDWRQQQEHTEEEKAPGEGPDQVNKHLYIR